MNGMVFNRWDNGLLKALFGLGFASICRSLNLSPGFDNEYVSSDVEIAMNLAPYVDKVCGNFPRVLVDVSAY